MSLAWTEGEDLLRLANDRAEDVEGHFGRVVVGIVFGQADNREDVVVELIDAEAGLLTIEEAAFERLSDRLGGTIATDMDDRVIGVPLIVYRLGGRMGCDRLAQEICERVDHDEGEDAAAVENGEAVERECLQDRLAGLPGDIPEQKIWPCPTRSETVDIQSDPAVDIRESEADGVVGGKCHRQGIAVDEGATPARFGGQPGDSEHAVPAAEVDHLTGIRKG